MMTSNNQKIQVALFGMDTRASKVMSMYLNGPCKGIAVVVEAAAAEIDIIDGDSIKFKEILEERNSKAPGKGMIVLALQPITVEGAVYVKKPIESEGLTAALKQVQAELSKPKKKTLSKSTVTEAPKSAEDPAEGIVQAATEKVTVSDNANQDEKENAKAERSAAQLDEQKKTQKHRTAIDLSDEVYSSYIGHVEGVDFTDKEQVLLASFNSKHYFLSYIQSALRVAKEKKRIIQLNANWKPLIIFPDTNEIWLDAKDVQLRAFSGILMKQWAGSGSGISLSATDPKKLSCHDKLENFYDADMLLWKVAIWTSKGRFPSAIDIHQPVYLKQWPNFTRLLITPHALQITAVLTHSPALMMDVVNQLKIKPEYVFVFISAAHALGLVGQEQHRPEKAVAPAAIKKPKAKGLLAQILGKLRK